MTSAEPFFFYRNRRFRAQIGKTGPFTHRFGHAFDLHIHGALRVGQVHQLLSLDLADPILALELAGLSRLPLVYGFQFEEGALEYDLINDNEIRVKSLDEESFCENWPYPHYPSKFTALPFSLGPAEDCTLTKFAEEVWQGIPEDDHDKFICIVPPSSRYGVHLWEESDFDHIHIKFFVDLTKKHVKVYNECD